MGYMGLTSHERWELERASCALSAILRRAGLPLCLSKLLDEADGHISDCLIVDEVVFRSKLAFHVRRAAAMALRLGGSDMRGLDAETFEFRRFTPQMIAEAFDVDDGIRRRASNGRA